MIYIVVAILIIAYLSKYIPYRTSKYYKQTKNPFIKVLLNKGKLGEYYTYSYLKKLEGNKLFLFNAYVPKVNDETSEIDVILLHDSGIYVFESKNYSGWIFGNEDDKTWTQVLPPGKGKGRSQKEHFLNPIIQNKGHIKWLYNFLKDSSLPIYSYIIFSDRCTLKKVTLTSGNHHVINRYNILSEVRKNAKLQGQKLSKSQLQELYNSLYPLTQVDEALKLQHIETIHEKYIKEETPQLKTVNNTSEHICPRCGGALVSRTASKGEHKGETFWGCSNFPKCRYIEK